jgi:Arc/MetJ family transcription regulator
MDQNQPVDRGGPGDERVYRGQRLGSGSTEVNGTVRDAPVQVENRIEKRTMELPFILKFGLPVQSFEPGPNNPGKELSPGPLFIKNCLKTSSTYHILKHEMRITVDIDDEIIDDLMKITGEKKKSPAVSKAVNEFVKRKKAKEFGRMLREGTFDYPSTNEAIEQQDV